LLFFILNTEKPLKNFSENKKIAPFTVIHRFSLLGSSTLYLFLAGILLGFSIRKYAKDYMKIAKTQNYSESLGQTIIDNKEPEKPSGIAHTPASLTNK
jgi:hypothetical protein